MAKQKIIVDGQEITLQTIHEKDYISLTDMARVREQSEPRFIIRNWLSNSNTLMFMEAWEALNNLNFNRAGMRTVRLESQDNTISISPKAFIERTNAIGIVAKSGRYGGTQVAEKQFERLFKDPRLLDQQGSQQLLPKKK